MSDWPSKSLDELCVRVTVGHVGSMAHEYLPDGIPFLRSQNIKPGRLDLSSVKYISEDFHRRLTKSQLQAGDLVIVRTGEPGATALIPDDLGPANCSDVVIARPGPGTVGRYLAYAINATARQFIDAHTVGAVQQHFNVASAKRLTVAAPPIIIQETIASLLGALDDKIAVNDRIAETSKNLGQAIFATHIGSASKALQDSCAIVMGQSPPGDSYNEIGVGIPFYQGTRDFGVHYPRLRVWSTAVTRHASAGDILVSVRAPVGDVNVASDACGIGRGLAALRAHTSPHVLHHALMFDSAVWSPFEGEGTVFSSINKQQLHALPLIWPSPDEEAHLETELRILDQRIMSALRENESLASLRDTLLPELMSGRLRIRDAEKIVEEAV